MSPRDHDRIDELRQRSHPASPRRSAHPVIALQRLIGNRGTARVLARDKKAKAGTFENSVRVGKLGTVEITESNIGDWTAKKSSAQDLIVTTKTGKHSDELKKLSEGKTRVGTIEVSTVTGQNTWIVVTFTNARIKGYSADAEGKTESWKAVDFDHVDIKRMAIGKARP